MLCSPHRKEISPPKSIAMKHKWHATWHCQFFRFNPLFIQFSFFHIILALSRSIHKWSRQYKVESRLWGDDDEYFRKHSRRLKDIQEFSWKIDFPPWFDTQLLSMIFALVSQFQGVDDFVYIVCSIGRGRKKFQLFGGKLAWLKVLWMLSASSQPTTSMSMSSGALNSINS